MVHTIRKPPVTKDVVSNNWNLEFGLQNCARKDCTEESSKTSQDIDSNERA